MDWRRAKTIFIISFILLDLFLAVQIHQMIEQKSNYLKADEISDEQIRDLLAANQIQMTIDPPELVTKIPALQAEITSLPNWNYDEKWIYHQSFTPPLSFANHQSLVKILKQKLSFFDDYRHSKEYTNTNQTTFLQYNGNHPIFDAKIICHISERKVTSIQALHFQIKDEVAIDFIPFNHALYNLITRENLPEGAKISNVVLGYRAMYYPNPKEVILVPVWRFTVNQQHYYIYATTNNLNKNQAWENNK